MSSNSLVNRCQGWSNPSTAFYGPVIISLSSYFSPAGLTSLVTISGENFYSYSTVLFATFSPTVYFINSNTLQFYVPSSLYPGTYPVQVYNGSTGSNIVSYTLDNSSGYWILNPNNSITNTNVGGLELAGPIQFPDTTIQSTAYNPLIGEIKMYGGITVPNGYLWCDGSSYNTGGNYAQLFAVIKHTYGGSGTTFNVPDLRQKFPLGTQDNTSMSIAYNNGNTTSNVLTGGNQQMSVNQLGAHTHSFTPTGTVTISPNAAVVSIDAPKNKVEAAHDFGDSFVTKVEWGTALLSLTNTISGNVGDINNTTTNSQEDILPPFTVVKYIICYK